MTKGKKYCSLCNGKGYILRERVISYTWKHGFKEPEYDMSIWNVLDPSCTYKKWRVDIGTLCGGHFKSFWFKKDALLYANGYKDTAYWVDLINNITEKSIRINNPESKKKDPNCKHTWMMRSPASWWCPQCHAKFNLSCKHGGSIACAICTKDFVKENEPFEDYLAKASW